MTKNCGFIALPLVAFGIALIASIAFGALQTHRIKGYKEKIAAINALGQEQERQTKLQIERDRKEKERADNEAKRRFADISARYRRLLNDKSSVLPAATASAGGSDRVCFSRDALNRSLTDFVTGVAGIAQDGDRGIVTAEIAKLWATAPSRPP